MARKPTFTKAKQAEFLEHMRHGMRRGAAAAALKLERRMVLDFIAEDEEFELQVLDAEGSATELVEEALFQAAVSGSVPAAKVWMDLHKPKPKNNLPALYQQPESDEMDQELQDLIALSREDDD